MDQLIAKLLEEGAVIKQAPITFVFVWGLGALITYVLIKRSIRGQLDDLRKWLTDRDNVITFLEKKLEIQQRLLDLQPTVGTELPAVPADLKEEKLLPPVLELIHFGFEDVAQDRAGFYFRAVNALICKAAILDFSLKPISGAVPWTEVQPQIFFKDWQGRVTHVNNAIWLGLDKAKVPFRYGITLSLVLAVSSPKRDFRTYERDSHESRPLERQLSGKEVRAQVRLVGEYMDDPRADISWYFKLIKGRVPEIIEITREEFDSGGNQ